MTSKAKPVGRAALAILAGHIERTQAKKAAAEEGAKSAGLFDDESGAAVKPARAKRAAAPAADDPAAANHAATDLNGQIELFIATGRAAAPRDEIATMEHPFYAIEDGDQRIISYEHNGTTLEITPSVKGRATIHDKDIVLFCVSKIVDAVNRGEEVSRTVCITARDLLKFTERSTSGRGYELLELALDRLAGTRIKTSVQTGKPAQRRNKGFGIIEGWETIVRGPKNRLEELRITLSDFTFDAAVAMQVLSIDDKYFKLRKATEKRLYELGRKHVGDQAKWKVSLELLHKKVGTRQELFKFRHAVRGIIDADTLPGYRLVYSHLDDTVMFFNRNEAGQLAQREAVAAMPTATKGNRPRVRAKAPAKST